MLPQQHPTDTQMEGLRSEAHCWDQLACWEKDTQHRCLCISSRVELGCTATTKEKGLRGAGVWLCLHFSIGNSPPLSFLLRSPKFPYFFTFWDRLGWVSQLLFPGRAELSHRDTLPWLRNNCSILSQRKNGVCCLMTHGSVIFLVSHHCDKTLAMKQLGLELRGLHSVATVGEGPQLVLLHLQVGKH